MSTTNGAPTCSEGKAHAETPTSNGDPSNKSNAGEHDQVLPVPSTCRKEDALATSPSSRLLLPPLSTGLNRKASPRELRSWVSLSLTLDGRDKITKVLQYSARLLAWWFQSPNFRPEYALRFKALQASLTQSRKAYRLGRSFVEMDKIRKIGAVALLQWHMRQALSRSSALSSSSPPTKSPPWKVFGMAVKMLGLLGFWAGDNVSFLTSTGVLDNYALAKSERLSHRKSVAAQASRVAARSYFIGAIAGLLVNLRSYWTFQQERRAAERTVEESSDGEKAEALQRLEKAKQTQFDLFVALLKSCCDVLVFSNNPGVELHKRFRGKKMHEGLHCVCGLISASTVLYSSYPDASP